MEWLLKIVDGPMKGAEIALVAGFRAKIGSSDACDVVLADPSLAEQAFELDVSNDAVTLIGPDGEAKAVAPLTIFRFGSSAFAVGPAGGVWGELKEPAGEEPAPDKSGSPSGESAGDAVPEASSPRGADAEADGKAAGEPPRGEESAGAASVARPRRRRLAISLGAILLLLVLGLVAWFFLSCGAGPSGETSVFCRLFAKATPPPSTPPPTLAEIAAQHGLTLGARNGRPLLTGNVAHRTERHAIRAIALASDPMTDFDLTDDESLQASATELLFVVTEGDLYATAASNRVVTLSGYAPDARRLETALRALNADVPGIARVVTSAVKIGGERPVRPTAASSAAPAEKPVAKAPTGAVPLPQNRAYAIAGILTKPYPCLVMRNGMRLVEGAQVDGAVIEKIEVDRLTLREGKTVFEWKP